MARPKYGIYYTCKESAPCEKCEFSPTEECLTKETKIAALLAALKELGIEVPQWQSIETAPDKGIILVSGGSHYHEDRMDIPNHSTLNLFNIVWKDKDGKWCGGFDDKKGEMRIIFNPAYWMPLPQPPKEAEQ